MSRRPATRQAVVGPMSIISSARSSLERLGRYSIDTWRYVTFVVAVLVAALWRALRPRSWRRTTRTVFLRQCFYTGNKATGLIALLGILLGFGVIFQAYSWLEAAGTRGILSGVIMTLLVREIAPPLVGLVVLGRSGAAIVSELGIMKATGQVQLLDVQGIDPFSYLVVPRVIAMGIMTFCLCLAFLLVTFLSGHVFASIAGLVAPFPRDLVDGWLAPMSHREGLALLLKTLLTGHICGVICCVEGLSVPPGANQRVPWRVARAMSVSFIALATINVVVSVILMR